MMSLVRNSVVAVMVVAAMLGWALWSFDVFLYSMLVGCAIVFVTFVVVETIKYHHLKPLRDRYKDKPYQLQLLGMTVHQTEREKLKPMDESSPFWNGKR